MTIAVYVFNIQSNKEYINFIYECFTRIARRYSTNNYIFIFEKKSELFSISLPNVSVVQISDKIFFFKKLLLKKKILSVLKKYKADVFITNTDFFIQKNKIPQCLIVQHSVDDLSAKRISKAETVCTDSEYRKKKITKYNIASDKVHVVYNGVDSVFQPVDFREKQIIKEQYSDDNEYFFCLSVGITKENLITLLKAFSIFKKRQKSNMQLLIADECLPNEKKFSEDLQLYKYRDEVKILSNLPVNDLSKINAASYAVIAPFNFAGKYLPILHSMKCESPVITNNHEVIFEVCGNAVLYFSSITETAIADKMMLIFKDENLRAQLIENGKDQIKKFSWDNAAEQLWKSVLNTNQKVVL